MTKPARATGPGPATSGEIPAVGMREPCPCGSGRRYKACHGRAAARAEHGLVQRPFQGLADECDWVALREIVPAATARLALAEPSRTARPVTLATVLPMAWPALVRADGEVFVGLQVQSSSGDASRDVADALLRALAAEPGTAIEGGALPGPGPRLQDVLDATHPLEPTVRDGFDFWVEGIEDAGEEVRASMDRANAAVVPTARLASVAAAYWCRIGDRNHLRWVLPEPEEALLDAFARLADDGALTLGEGTRYVGAFRAHGLLVPVWDLVPGTPVEEVEEPALALRDRLDQALAATGPLSDAQRRRRSGLAARQLTLR